jgi:hypothetical protein
MTDHDSSGSVPRWNGQAETLDHFEDRVKDWILGTKIENRGLLGPRLRSAMDEHSQQYEEAKKVTEEELTSATGALKVVEALRKTRGPTSLQEAVSQVKNLWKGVRREPGEGMRTWTSRFMIYIAKVGRALHGAVPDIPQDTWLHPLLQGIQLLEGTGLDPSEEAAILACSGPRGNSYMIQDLVKALTDQWSDSQIKARDSTKFRKRGPAGVHGLDAAQDASWAWTGEYDEGSASSAYWTGDFDYGYPTEYPDYQYEEYTYNEEEEELAAAIDMVAEDAQRMQSDEGLKADAELHDAAATMAAAARTFAEARTLLNNVKEARGYFPVVGLGAWQPPAGPAETSPPGQGKNRVKGKKGKGGKGGKSKPPPPHPPPEDYARTPWSGKGPSPAARAGAFNGKCLLCGQFGHRAADCPNRGRDGQNSKKRRAYGTAFVSGDGNVAYSSFVGMTATVTNNQAEPEDLVGFNLVTCEGFGLLDGGASVSVGGVNHLQVIQDHLTATGTSLEVREQSRRFAFAGGDETTGHTQCELNLETLDGIPFTIFVVDRPAPILLGVDFLTKFGIQINYATNKVYSHRLSRSLPAVLLPSGHLALNLRSMVQNSCAKSTSDSQEAQFHE